MKFVPVSSTQCRVATPELSTCTVVDISEAYEGLLVSYMELSDAQRNLDETCQIMDNIELSMKMIKAGGSGSIKMLNVDRSLEDLVGVAEESITIANANIAMEGAFGDAMKSFCAKVKAFFMKIVQFFKNLFSVKEKVVVQYVDRIVEVTKEVPVEKTVVKEVQTPAPKEDPYKKTFHNIASPVLKASAIDTVIQSTAFLIDMVTGEGWEPRITDEQNRSRSNESIFEEAWNHKVQEGISKGYIVASKNDLMNIRNGDNVSSDSEFDAIKFVPDWLNRTNDKYWLAKDETSLSMAGYASENDMHNLTKLAGKLSEITREIGRYNLKKVDILERVNYGDKNAIRQHVRKQCRLATLSGRWCDGLMTDVIKFLSKALAALKHTENKE